jgi:hypothetical protein
LVSHPKKEETVIERFLEQGVGERITGGFQNSIINSIICVTIIRMTIILAHTGKMRNEYKIVARKSEGKCTWEMLALKRRKDNTTID